MSQVELADRQVRIERIASANTRLRNLYKVPEDSSEDVVSHILNSYHKGKYDVFGIQERFDTAMTLLAQDLLVSNAYKFNGEPSKFLLSLSEHFPGIDLRDYSYIGMNSQQAIKMLAGLCLSPSEVPYVDVVMYKYFEKFQEKGEFPPFIVTPCEINIRTEPGGGVYVAPADQFEPLYGGGEANITIYKYKWHRIAEMPKQA